jgi:hypothetical protein
MRLNI